MKHTPNHESDTSLEFDFSETEPTAPAEHVNRPHMTEKRIAAILKTNAAKKKYFGEHCLGSRLFRIWRCMEMRCYKPSHEAYPRYGGRGIRICPEWLNDYRVFRDWAVENGYAEHLTIDRIDNDKGYEPGNCRWLTRREQNNNRRCSVILTAWGETKPAAEWLRDPRCIFAGSSVHRRLKKGVPPEIALSQKIVKDRSAYRTKTLTAFGETKTIFDWAKDIRCVVELKTLRNRMRREWAPWTDEEIITTPISSNGKRGQHT